MQILMSVEEATAVVLLPIVTTQLAATLALASVVTLETDPLAQVFSLVCTSWRVLSVWV